MAKPPRAIKYTIKSKGVKKCPKEPSVPYVRDFYLKDFKYISPKGVGEDKNDTRDKTRTNRGCKLFAKMWLVEVIKGLKQFLYEGSLHGVKYIFEPTFTRKERITWVLIVVISIALCAVNIVNLCSKWRSTPYVNVIDSMPTPIWAIPFPSVILCPHLHVKLSYANVLELGDLERFYAGLVCPQMKAEKIRLKHRITAEEIIKLMDFIVKGSPTCEEVIQSCKWSPLHGSDWSTTDCCKDLFNPILTDLGLCFIFNSLPLNGFTNETLPWLKTFYPSAKPQEVDWNMDGGYLKSYLSIPNSIPRRLKASGESHGLGLNLYLNSSEHQFDCDGNDVGFTIVINSPTAQPYTSSVIRLPMNRKTSVQIYPTTFRTDSALRLLKPAMRQCYFQGERKLEFFAFYEQANCKEDLFMREARDTCGCVYYNWPRYHITDPVCSTVDDYKCMLRIRENLDERLKYAFYVDSDDERRNDLGSTLNWSCFPPCTDVLYTNQVFYSNVVHRAKNTTSFDQSKGKKEFTQMFVHFQSDMLLGHHRHSQHDIYQLAGAVGGLLSLFLGFSNISVAELIYFVILRPIRIAFSNLYVH